MYFGKKQKRGGLNNRFLFKIVGIIFLVVIFALIISDYKIYQKKRELNLQINNYKKQIEDINRNSQTLKNEIANSNNIDYLEKIAYEQLGQQKPGEKEIIFITPKSNNNEAQSAQNFWDIKFWFGWLSGAFNWIKNIF